jgi:hypothetical protein
VGVLALSLAVNAAAFAARAAAEETGSDPAGRPQSRRESVTQPVEGVLLTHAATEQAAQAAQAAAQQAAAARAAALAPHTGVDWDGIARCETGGNWRMQGSTFSGGLGFANSTWSSFGGHEFAPNAGMASREEQIAVAERVYGRYGLSGWGCRRFG